MKKIILFFCCFVMVMTACGPAANYDTPSESAPVDTAAPAATQPGDDPLLARPEIEKPDISLPFEIPLSDSSVILQAPPPLVTTWEGFLYIDNDHALHAAGIVPYYQLRFEELRFPGNPLTEQIVVEENVRSVSLSSMSSSIALMYTAQDGKLWEYGSLTGKTDGSRARHVMDEVHAVTVGYQHVLALRSDGTLWGWGFFNGERADTPVRIANDVIAATDCSFLKRDGTLWLLCEYSDVNAGPGLAGVTPQNILDNVVFAAGTSAVQSDGTVWYWEESAAVPTAKCVFSGAIACGEDYVITEDNRLLYWPGGFGADLTTEITDNAVYAVRTRDYSTEPSKDTFAVLDKAGELVIHYSENE